ncbi:MAG TPA: YCF48-related protein [Paludibacter sp.]
MKTIKQFLTILFLLSASISISAQCELVSCVKKVVNCGDSVQLDAEPILDGVWDTVHTGLSDNFNSIYFRDSNTGFAVTTTGGIYKTTDGGTNWISKSSGTTNGLYAIRFYDKNTGYAVGAGSTIIKTTNGGDSWVTLNSGTTSKIFRSLYILNENTIFVVGSTSVLKTLDGGQTWTEILLNTAVYDVTFPSFNTGYICGATGAIFQTKDGGNTWIKQYSVAKTLYSVSFVSDSIGYSAGGNLLVKFSYGISSAENILLPMLSPSSTIKTVSFFNANCGYITGYDGSSFAFVYKTTDGGQNWQQVAFFLSKKVMGGSFIGLNTGYICGTGGFMAKLKVDLPAVENYSWTPATGLNNPNIKNPKASPSELTLYEVTRNANGCITTASVYVDNAPLYVNAVTTKYIGCEGSTQLGPVVTSYSGKTKLRYKWTPSTGLDCDTIATPLATVSAVTTYSVEVTTPAGCTGSSNTTVGILPLRVNAGADRTISCGGNVQLSVSSNYSGTNKLHYKWTPNTGLNNDTIANPVCSGKVTTTYIVAVNSPSGCLSKDTVKVTVNSLTINAGTDQTIICGGSVQLLTTTNYTGSGNLKYKWTPSTGLNNDTISNPTASVNSTTTYTVTVTSPEGCTAIDNVIVSVTPLTVNAGVDKTANCGTLVQLAVVSTNYNGSGQLKYKWTPATGLDNDTISNPTATAGNRTYTVTVTTPSGCSASDNVALSIIPMDKPAINYVGINENNKNILVWTKPVNGLIDSFNIYRETNVTNSFSKIGTVAFASEALYVDTLSMPDVQSNKYKISVVDDCGNETALSDQHKTMHLSINKGINTTWNLIWEAYEGNPVSTYNIYRGTSASNIQIIGSLSGSNTQFTDYTAPAGYVYYQIEAVSSSAAGVPQNKQSVRQVTETSYSSRSNIATNKSGADGIIQLKDITELISIYPNPASTKIEVDIHANLNSGMKIRIYNLTGSLVIDQDLHENKQIIDLGMLNNGVYLLFVLSDKFIGNQKLIIEK